MIQIENHGPLILSTNYWDSEFSANGKLIISPNAGTIRCLLPPLLYPVVGDLRRCSYAILSRGTFSRELLMRYGVDLSLSGQDGIEIMWEDHTDSPHVWHVTADSCLMLPGDPTPNQWVIACWVERRGQPHKALDRQCYWRSRDLPCMDPI